MLVQQLRVTRKNGFAFHNGTHAAPRNHLKIAGFRQCFSGFFIAAYYGLPQRMLGKLFGGSGQTVYFAFIKAFGNAFCRNDLGSAAGKSAGFIKGNYLDIGQPFQRVALANEKAVSCGIADGGHNGRGSCQHQCAGAKYNKNRDGTDDLPRDKPCKRRDGERCYHYPCCPAVGKTDDLCFAGIRRLYKADHSLNGAVLSDFCRFHLEDAELVDGAA